MTLHQADKRARELFKQVFSVTHYTDPRWRCPGWRGFRVVLNAPNGELHWMSPRGVHEKHTCCERPKE